VPDLGVTIPILRTPAEKFGEFAQLADAAGFRSLWLPEDYRNPFVMHTVTAAATKDIRLATGIAQAFGRSPFEMANAAVDVDELSGGRLILGIGSAGDDWLRAFHSSNNSNVIARISEYVDMLRTSWRYFESGASPDVRYEGQYYRFEPLPLNPWSEREMARPAIPIYLAAMRPRMLRLAGAKADGTVGYAHTAAFAAQKVLPRLAEGARGAGRDPRDLDYACLTVCSVSSDRAEAMRRARLQVGIYVSIDITDPVVQHHGLEAEQAAIRATIEKDGFAAAGDATSDELVDLFAIAGTPDEARAKAVRFQEAIPHVVLSPPYAPSLGRDETEDAFRNIIDTFGSAG
jgi:alkanesulfonate monooxygenase SsuD/methylene tetrahydromethanopterin reductase-like flavin-dependent oxidoreductase (luciferase family)